MPEGAHDKVREMFNKENNQSTDTKEQVAKGTSPPARSPVLQASSAPAQTRNGQAGHKVISLGSLVNKSLVNDYQRNLDELKKQHN